MRIGRLCLILLALAVSPVSNAASDASTATVSLRPLQLQVQLFGQVRPQHTYHVTAGLDGRLSEFAIRPADRIRRGEVVARLAGAAVEAQSETARAAVAQDQAEAASAQSVLALTQKKFRQHLATRQKVLEAQMALNRARTQLAIATAHQMALRAQALLRAPTDGTVTAVSAADGDYVKAGDVLVTIVPDKGLWLAARAYGPQAQRLRVGQTGRFTPGDGGTPTTVTVAATVPETGAPGIWEVYLTSGHTATGWYAGQAGTLDIALQTRSLPALPTAALIMDQGQWWVMVAEGGKAHAVQVSPVARRDGWTWFEKGPGVGQHVIVQGAYQRFHEDFAKQYANPD